MGLSLGDVGYDIVANDKTGPALEKARSNFVITAGDIVKAIGSVASSLAEFDEKNSSLNESLGITALTLGMNAEELRSWANELSGPKDSIKDMSDLIGVLAKKGVDTHDSMISTAKAFDTFGDAVGVSSAALVTQMSPALASFKIPVTEVGDHMDVLAKTFNETGVSADLFSSVVARAGPEIASTGLSMEDMCAVLLVLKSRGYDGRNMMSELNNALSSNADANEDGKVSMEEFLGALKINNDEMATQKTRITESSKGYAEQAAKIRDDSIPVNKQYGNSIDIIIMGLGGLTTPLIQASSLFGSVASSISTLAIPAMFLFQSQIAALGTSITGSLSGGLSSITGAVSGISIGIGGAIVAGLAIGFASVWALDKAGILTALSNLGADIQKSPMGAQIMGAMKIVLAPIGSIGAAIIDIVRGDFSRIGEDMMEPFRQAGASIDGQMQFISSSIDGAASWVSSSLGNMGQAATNMNFAFSDAVNGTIASAVSIFSGIGAAFYTMAGEFQGIFSQLMGGIQTMIQGTFEGFVSLGYNIIVSLVNGIVSGGNLVISTFQNIFSGIAGFFTGLIGGGVATRASGGPVDAGTPYLVGESGPELFVPSSSGSIIPNGGTSAGGGDTITIAPGAIVVNGADGNAEEIARLVMQMFTDELAHQRAARGYRAA